MTKKHFIKLADCIREYNEAYKSQSVLDSDEVFTRGQLEMLAGFCRSVNPNFNKERWLDYVAGLCGPNGGAR